MKAIKLLFLILLLSLMSKAQTATMKDIELNNKGHYTSFINNNEIFNIGDTLILGKSFGILKYKCILNNLTGTPISSNTIYKSGNIKDILIKNKHIDIILRTDGISLYIYDFVTALESGEIKSNTKYTSDDAINILKEYKEKLNLELITQEEYNKKKEELSKFIK